MTPHSIRKTQKHPQETLVVEETQYDHRQKNKIQSPECKSKHWPKNENGQDARRSKRAPAWLEYIGFADPACFAELEALAGEIAGKNAEPQIKGIAQRIAEAQIELVRLRRVRHALLNGNLQEPKLKLEEIKVPTVEYFLSLISNSDALSRSPKGPSKFLAILTDLTKELIAIDRYEQRALSRRKFAIRELADIQNKVL